MEPKASGDLLNHRQLGKHQPADARLFGLKEHTEAHAHRHTGVVD